MDKYSAFAAIKDAAGLAGVFETHPDRPFTDLLMVAGNRFFQPSSGFFGVAGMATHLDGLCTQVPLCRPK